MSVSASALRKLSLLNLSSDQMAGVLDILADSAEADEARRVAQRRRAARWRERLNLSASERGDLSESIRARDSYTCFYYGSRELPIHVDHIAPLIQGGTNNPENLVAACAACNTSKGGRTPCQWGGE